MYAGGWTGGFLRREGGLVVVFFTEVTHEADFSYSVGRSGWGSFGVAESNIKPLHIAYFIFVVVYIVVSFFHFKKNANIYCTLSVPF